jgi:hypothetical protein
LFVGAVLPSPYFTQVFLLFLLFQMLFFQLLNQAFLIHVAQYKEMIKVTSNGKRLFASAFLKMWHT